MNIIYDEYFTEYSDGKITVEKLAEKLHVNFYSLHKAFMYFANTEHHLTRDCWCNPRVVHVDAKDTRVDRKDMMMEPQGDIGKPIFGE
jgi:hypothetical protein